MQTVKYYSEEQGEPCFDSATRIDFKRASISILILESESDPKSKFELFKRLNTGGSHLSDQEIRNSMILMYNEGAYNAMEEFSKREDVMKMFNLPESYSEKRTDMDIITRFLVMKNYENIEDVSNGTDINVFLDESIGQIIVNKDFDINKQLEEFDKLIYFLGTHLQDDYGFRVYDDNKNQFVQSFNWFVFEVLVWGCVVLNDVNTLDENPEFYIEKIKKLESIGDYKKRTSRSNVRVIERMKLAKEEAMVIFTDD